MAKAKDNPPDDIVSQVDALIALHKENPSEYFGTISRGTYSGRGVNEARKLVDGMRRNGPGADYAAWHRTMDYVAKLPLG